MSEFILVKNQDGSGNLLIPAKAIEGVRDYTEKEKSDGYSGNSRIRFWTAEGSDWYDSASTAAEVLAAIQEAQGAVPQGTRAAEAVLSGRYKRLKELAEAEGFSPVGYGIPIQDASRFNAYHEGELPTRNAYLAGPVFLGEPSEQARVAMEKLGIATHSITETRAQVGCCTCPQYQGDNPACPVHGVGTAWRDLHGE